MKPPPGPVEVGSECLILKEYRLSLDCARKSELNINVVVVRPDGKIALTMVGDVTSFGLTLPELGRARKPSRPASNGVLALA